MKQYSRIVADSIRDSRVLSEIRGFFMNKDLQTLNVQSKLALWAGRISECRSSGQKVKDWCREIAIAILWTFIYNNKWGLLNNFLQLFGLEGKVWMAPETLFGRFW